MGQPRKILLLSVSAGAGHLRAAEALRAYAGSMDEEVVAIHLDALDFVTARLRKLYTDFYLGLVRRAPTLWSHLYRVTNEAEPAGWTHRMRRLLERRDCKDLIEKIAGIEPDLIICTHFLPAEILSCQIAAGKLACPAWVQVTDFDLHRMWVHPNITGYFASNEEVAFLMRSRGIPADAIHVTGIPVMPGFSKQLDRGTCAAELGLDGRTTTFLLMGGGAGIGGLSAIAQRVLELPGEFQVIALAGTNAAELAKLEALEERHRGRLAPLGFTDKVERLMACADLAITKPGGATTSECLAVGLPMILISPIPGQEDRNANFLLEHGVALKAFDLAALEYRVRWLTTDTAALEEMRRKARALGRPDAAARALEIALKRTEEEPCLSQN